MIYTVTLNPALDKTVYVPKFTIDAVNRAEESLCDAGGKGINVSKLLAALGQASTALCLVGGRSGAELKELLTQIDAIDLHAYEIGGSTRTNYKLVDTELGTHTDINEPGPEVSSQELEPLLHDLAQRARANDIVVISGSCPKGIDPAAFSEIVAAIKATSAKVIVDVDGPYLKAALSVGPSMIKPNNFELEELVGKTLTTQDEIISAAQELLLKGPEAVLVSLGKDGALYVDSSQCYAIDPVHVQVQSTVGAGDSMVAGFVYGLAKGMTLDKTLAYSVASSAAAVMQKGSAAPSRAQIEQLLAEVKLQRIS